MELSLSAIKLIVEKVKKGGKGRRLFTDELKKTIINFHYSSGMSIWKLSFHLDIPNPMLYEWKKVYGEGQTAFLHGRTMRNDVKTRCLAVKEVLDNNIEIETVANIYGVSPQTIKTWVTKHQNDYSHLIHSPDGIPYLVKEKKMVYGRENINKIRALLQGQADQLMCLIDTMHMSGAQAEAMKKCAEATLERETELAIAANLLSESGIDIK